MPEWADVGKAFLVFGGLLALVGLILILTDKLTGTGGGLGWFGKLPGDLLIKREHFTLYVPLATSLLISLVVSALLYLLSRR